MGNPQRYKGDDLYEDPSGSGGVAVRGSLTFAFAPMLLEWEKEAPISFRHTSIARLADNSDAAGAVYDELYCI